MKNNEEVLNIVYRVSNNLKFEVNDKGLVVVYQKQDYKIQNFLRKLKLNIPEYKKIELDEYCSTVFLLIDGKKTVKEIGEILDKKFGDKVHPLYERLLIFLNHIDVNCKYIEKIN